MAPAQKDRLKLLADLLDTKTLASVAMIQYFNVRTAYRGEDALTIREIHFVLAVEPGEGKSTAELAELLNVTKGAISQLAARLEERDYIRRANKPGRRRQVIVTLTEKGEAEYEFHVVADKTVHERINKLYFSDYTDEQLVFLRDYEKRMEKMFEELKKNNLERFRKMYDESAE